MKYNDLRSIITSSKSPYDLSAPTNSFFVVQENARPYVEPTFTKEEFKEEKPRFLLISAVGASGKSALTRKLSFESGMPILDLGAHRPVADNAMTGLLTTSFPIDQLSSILAGLRNGSFGVIIDGVDEGRSKVNEQAFNAFIDDLIKLSEGSSRTTFILLGRTQALVDCWVYLQEKGVSVGLASIDPFSHDRAIAYIDTFAEPPQAGHRSQYELTRNSILEKLSNTFSGNSPVYLNFIGYPPVLDAIATLLRSNKNYFKLGEELTGELSDNVEANLLVRIASYILTREREDKIVPNVLPEFLAAFPIELQAKINKLAYVHEEQSARLVAYVLRQPYVANVLPQPELNAAFEERLAPFLADHPFLDITQRAFRNAIFEAMCLAVLIASGDAQHSILVNSYVKERRSNLYLIQLLNQVNASRKVNIDALHVIIAAALEFRSTDSKAEITVETLDAVDSLDGSIEVELLIEVMSLKEIDDIPKRFTFSSRVKETDNCMLGHRLSSCSLDLPCEITFAGSDELELTAPVDISARRISLLSSSLVLKAQPSSVETQIIFDTDEISSMLTNIVPEGGVDFTVRVASLEDHHYPLVTFIKKRSVVPSSDGIGAKYLKLRRILTHFRSHSKGSMAKFRDKVDNERVAGNEVGKLVLDRLIADGVLFAEGKFYFLVPANVDKHLGISWMRLRDGEVSERLVSYLRSIN